MKKLIYSLGLTMILGSVSLYAEEGEKRIGNVGAYEETVLSLTLENCMNNIVWDFPDSFIRCDIPLAGNADDKVLVSTSATSFEKLVFDFKDGAKVKVYAGTLMEKHWIVASSFKKEDKNRGGMWSGPDMTKDEFRDFVDKYLSKVGNKVTIKYLKIEK